MLDEFVEVVVGGGTLDAQRLACSVVRHRLEPARPRSRTAAGAGVVNTAQPLELAPSAGSSLSLVAGARLTVVRPISSVRTSSPYKRDGARIMPPPPDVSSPARRADLVSVYHRVMTDGIERIALREAAHHRPACRSALPIQSGSTPARSRCSREWHQMPNLGLTDEAIDARLPTGASRKRKE